MRGSLDQDQAAGWTSDDNGTRFSVRVKQQLCGKFFQTECTATVAKYYCSGFSPTFSNRLTVTVVPELGCGHGANARARPGDRQSTTDARLQQLQPAHWRTRRVRTRPGLGPRTNFMRGKSVCPQRSCKHFWAGSCVQKTLAVAATNCCGLLTPGCPISKSAVSHFSFVVCDKRKK